MRPIADPLCLRMGLMHTEMDRQHQVRGTYRIGDPGVGGARLR
jgi:hypothetical protein